MGDDGVRSRTVKVIGLQEDSIVLLNSGNLWSPCAQRSFRAPQIPERNKNVIKKPSLGVRDRLQGKGQRDREASSTLEDGT